MSQVHLGGLKRHSISKYIYIFPFLLEEEKYTVVIIKPDAVAEGKVDEIKQTVNKPFIYILVY